MTGPRHQAETLLRRMLGSDAAGFRPGQWETVEALALAHRRVLLVRATGWGKSIVYFLAGRLLRDRGQTLVISPLRALMRNQAEAARRLGLAAATVNADNSRDWPDLLDAWSAGRLDLLLVSPERLGDAGDPDGFLARRVLDRPDRVGLLVLDEAHCLSDWGHDFRPDYRRLARLATALAPGTPVLAATATANPRVEAEILAVLGPAALRLRGPLARPGLQLQTLDLPAAEDRLAWLAAAVPALPGSGIIYTLTRRDADTVAAWLAGRGIAAAAYHAGPGLDPARRQDLEQRLLDNAVKALVATSALGMGFDKPDLGFVLHYQMPPSVVHYYQQVGRAGRALARSHGVLLAGAEDEDIAAHFIRRAFPSARDLAAVLAAVTEAEGLAADEPAALAGLTPAGAARALAHLAAADRPVVVRRDRLWWPTGQANAIDDARRRDLTAARGREWRQMQDYLDHTGCLMQFLATALGDDGAAPCGICARCLGRPVLDIRPSRALRRAAADSLSA
jgi:ATP-dependent DNA helicase RecQ